MKRNNKKIELQIWDTAGQERFRSLSKNCSNQIDGIILVYDIGIKESFLNMKIFYKNLGDTVDFKKVGIILVGIISDIPREVSEKMAQEFYQKNNLAFLELSTKDKKEVDEAFFKLIDIMININPKKNKFKIGNLISSTKVEVKQKKK